jgi:hypothetical protein
MWASSTSPIKKLDEKIGSNTKIIVSKNKLTFKKRTIQLPIYDNFGVDDLGSCVDFLTEQKVWAKSKQTIKASHFSWEGTRENIIRRIERANNEDELFQLVGEAWTEKEDKLKIDRKRRYK